METLLECLCSACQAEIGSAGNWNVQALLCCECRPRLAAWLDTRLDFRRARQRLDVPTSAQEAEAHAFSLALLMPDYLLKMRVQAALTLRLESDEKRIVALAKEYNVSREMMTARLIDLKLLA